MVFISDNAIDNELPKMKSFIEALKVKQKTFSNTFHLMTAKDRARALTEIQAAQKSVLAFIEKSKKIEIVNSGTKFSLENLKQTYQTLMHLWRRTEKNLETFSSGSPPKRIDPEDDATKNAVDKYVLALKNLGHSPNTEMINEFKTRLDSAYEKARAQSGGKHLTIEIVQEGSKIKVRMEPKD